MVYYVQRNCVERKLVVFILNAVVLVILLLSSIKKSGNILVDRIFPMQNFTFVLIADTLAT